MNVKIKELIALYKEIMINKEIIVYHKKKWSKDFGYIMWDIPRRYQ